MTTSLWTPALKERVETLWPNHSTREICAILTAETGLKFTRNQVIGIAHRMGLTVNDKTKIHPHTSRKAEGRPLKPRVRKPKLKIINNGGLGRWRVIQSIETEMPALKCAAVEPLNLTLTELNNDECHFIEGEPVGGCYCGHKTENGSYCRHHRAVMYAPPWRRAMEAAE